MATRFTSTEEACMWLFAIALAGLLVAAPAQAQILWTGDSENGDLREWYLPCTTAAPCGNEGGGEFNSGGGADSAVTTARVRSGNYAIIQTLNSSSESGTRLFRWRESQNLPEGYYSFWTYFPQGFAPADGWGWWMHSGFKVRRTQGGASNNLLHLFLDYTYDPNNMYLMLTYFDPRNGNQTRYKQRLKAMPVGKWFQTEVYLRQSTSATNVNGQYIVWLDGVEIFNLNNIVTNGPGTDGKPMWEATTNYGYKLTPASITKYVDDAVISTTRIGAEPPPPPPPAPDTSPPSVPSGVVAMATGSTSIEVEWLPSTDDVGVTVYEVWRDGIWHAQVTEPFFEDAGLAPAMTYDYQVRAGDAAGNWSDLSDVAHATTDPTASPSSGDETAPIVEITSPANGATVPRKTLVAVRFTVTERDSAVVATLFANRSSICSVRGEGSHTCLWRVPAQPRRSITLHVEAGSAGGTGEDSVRVETR